MMKFYIKTHGCKSNQLESTVIKEKLVAEGFENVSKLEEADVYILNSCSVTENADNEALRTIRHAKNQQPEIITVLTGCSAQLNAEKLVQLPFVDIVLGNDDKFNIVEILNSKKSTVTDIFKIERFNNQTIHDYSNTRGYLKIQDGCNNYCSYCTIPLARGKSRSNSIENIIEQVKIYTDIGIKEVVLTGIHIGQWGEDLKDGKKLFNLLVELEKIQIERYRLGSLNPLEMDGELLDFLSISTKFCPHFHLSLQSLNDKTLKAMNRHYSAQDCVNLIDKINAKFDRPFLGSDIIVGFPDETDEDFSTTAENARKSGLSNIHVFPYSVRNNTEAAKMENQVPEKTKKSRASMLQEIARNKFNSFEEENFNTETRILIEKRADKKTCLLKGVTDNYLNVFIDSKDKVLLNTIQKVKILNKKDDKLFCTIIEE